jgi:hypothetical protein
MLQANAATVAALKLKCSVAPIPPMYKRAAHHVPIDQPTTCTIKRTDLLVRKNRIIGHTYFSSDRIRRKW